jgi:predicted TIM-barrel fold metal-dependent hydrolase
MCYYFIKGKVIILIIDFHVHAFADKIAEKALSKLTQTTSIKPCTNATVSDTLDKMELNNIDIAVMLPIATKPSQQTVINDWAKETCSEKLYCFGSVHPEAEDALQELERIKALGLYGIKLHPDYQNFFTDDERVFPVYEKCQELGLPISFHAGYDPLSPDLIHGTATGFYKITKTFPKLTMILAHFGGINQWDKIEELICGLDHEVYLDISATSPYITDERAERMIKLMGADKILYASDMPWDSPSLLQNLINRINLTDEERNLIFYKNAQRILGLNKS